MALRPCIDCGQLSDKARCPTHRAQVERNRKPRPTNQTRDSRERKRRAEAVAAHRHINGSWCPGYGVPAHPSADLTADHVVAVANGGAPDGPLMVLCRSCNGRKANR
jgi:5-methylcytosine-specific restriction protein A